MPSRQGVEFNMRYSFAGWRSQFTDLYRIIFPLFILMIIIVIGHYINGGIGLGLIIGGIAGLAASVRDSLTYKLFISEEYYLKNYVACISSLGFNEIARGIYELKSWFPQYDSQKIMVEKLNTNCIILSSTRFNIRRIAKRMSKT